METFDTIINLTFVELFGNDAKAKYEINFKNLSNLFNKKVYMYLSNKIATKDYQNKKCKFFYEDKGNFIKVWGLKLQDPEQAAKERREEKPEVITDFDKETFLLYYTSKYIKLNIGVEAYAEAYKRFKTLPNFKTLDVIVYNLMTTVITAKPTDENFMALYEECLIIIERLKNTNI